MVREKLNTSNLRMITPRSNLSGALLLGHR